MFTNNAIIYIEVEAICPSYGELCYNITLFGEDKVTKLLTTQSSMCSRVCNITLPLSGPGGYQLELQAVNSRGTSDPVIRNFSISGKNCEIAAHISVYMHESKQYALPAKIKFSVQLNVQFPLLWPTENLSFQF